MTDRLPARLTREPLIDAVFELRFSGPVPASDIVPGFLFGKLDGTKTVERLPSSELPRQLRDADPNLRFAPLIRMHWGEFILLIGDRTLGVACKLPYPGWAHFRPAILRTIELLQGMPIINAVHRLSMKYVDLVPAATNREQIDALQLRLSLGPHELREENFHIRMEVPKDGLVNVIQVVAPATATHGDGHKRVGVIVDIDSIWNLADESMDVFSANLPDRLDRIHQANKRMFFACLREQTISNLGPVYE